MKGGRQGHRLDGRAQHPARAVADQRAAAHQAAHDLLDEQRVPPGARQDEIAQPRESRLPRRAEQAVDQLPCLVQGERGEPDLGRFAARHSRRARLRPVRQ